MQNTNAKVGKKRIKELPLLTTILFVLYKTPFFLSTVYECKGKGSIRLKLAQTLC